MTSLEPSHRITSDPGIELPLYHLPGEGPRILVAHATGFHSHCYLELARRLEGAVWLHDFRAHGDAAAPADVDLRWEGFGRDALAVAKALPGDGPLYAFGHSMGAAALLMAAIAEPRLFSYLFLYEPIVYPPDLVRDHGAASRWTDSTRRRKNYFPSRAAALENYGTKPPYNAFHASALEGYIDHGFRRDGDGGLHLKCDREHEATIYEVGTEHLTWDHLGDVSCPVTVAYGEVGPPNGPGDWAPRIGQLIPGAQIRGYADHGHLYPLEDPVTIARHVNEAFER